MEPRVSSREVRRSIRRRMLSTGVLLAFVPLSAVFVTVHLQNERMLSEATAISQELTRGDLRNAVKHVYALAESYQAWEQADLRSDLNLARSIANEKGLLRLGPPTLIWPISRDASAAASAFQDGETRAIPEDATVELPTLFVGDVPLGPISSTLEHAPIVDSVRDLLGADASVYQRVNLQGDLLRVATTLRDEEGQRSLGVLLGYGAPESQNTPLIAAILRGETYLSHEMVGRSHRLSGYAPLFDAEKRLVGALAVTEPEAATAALRRAITEIVVGKTGYAFVLDPTGRYIVSKHGLRDGEVIAQRPDLPGSDIAGLIQKALSLRPGQMTEHVYLWSNNPGDPPQRKLSYVMYFEPWRWIIGAGTYEHEIMEAPMRVAQIGEGSSFMLGGVLIAALVAAILMWLAMAGDIATPITEAHAELAGTIAQLEEERHESLALDELGNLLLNSTVEEEMYQLVIQTCRRVFPRDSGELAILDPGSPHLRFVGSFGTSAPTRCSECSKDDCWAVRRGRTHVVTTDGTAPLCNHLQDVNIATGSVCVPMSAEGVGLGMICLRLAPDLPRERAEALLKRRASQVAAILERFAPCLSNIRLRERLRTQSIRDPLTGLFNRRHMEEFLVREVRRAERHRSPISVMMIDLDHFKTFNDRYGHDAGDEVLRGVGRLLEGSARGEDIACRYGGEEFTLIFPGLDIEVARRRGEEIRSSLKALRFRYNDETLSITASVGVATFPHHGETIEQVLRAADVALYQAKAIGRNCLVAASDPHPGSSEPTMDVNRTGET